MRIAQVTEWGSSPKCVDISSPPVPDSSSGYEQITVVAVGMHHLTRARAAGKHYSVGVGLPHVPGVDGVGVTRDGRAVYFFTFATDQGSYAERVNLPKENIFFLPQGLDPLQAAVAVNPTVSSWMALKRRTINLPKDFIVLIMGVTSNSGLIAVSLARQLGAGKVLGCGRDEEKMSKMHDVDQVIPLRQPVEETDFSTLGDVDVILDYIWGPPTAHLLHSLKTNPCRPVQYIQIGNMASLELTIRGEILRSKKLTLTGSGMGSFSVGELRAELPELLEAIKILGPSPLNIVAFDEIEQKWGTEKVSQTIFKL